MISNIVKKRREVGRGDVFHYFPGGDEVELHRLAIERHLKWFGDVAGEQIDVSQRGPVGPASFEGVIGAFESCPNPAEVQKIFDHLSAGTAEIETAQGRVAE